MRPEGTFERQYAEFLEFLRTNPELKKAEDTLYEILSTGTLAGEVLDRASKAHGEQRVYDMICEFMKESGVSIRHSHIDYRVETLKHELNCVNKFVEKSGVEILLEDQRMPEDYEAEIHDLARRSLDEAGYNCVVEFMRKTGSSVLRHGPVRDGVDKHKYLKDVVSLDLCCRYMRRPDSTW